MINSLIIFSSISFMIYGLLSFISKEMQDEIDRWGFSNFKYFLGLCQLFGGFGLLIGLKWPYLALIMSFLLLLMMLSALIVRFKIKDPIIRYLPASFFLIVNAYIFLNLLEKLNYL